MKKLIFKIFSKVIISKKIDRLSYEFKDLDIDKAQKDVAPSQSYARPPLLWPTGNFGHPLITVTGPTAQNTTPLVPPRGTTTVNWGSPPQPGPYTLKSPLPTTPPYAPKRLRAVTEGQALNIIERLNNKIASLIRLRTATQNTEAVETLTLTIDTLSATRELLREVFIEQIKGN